MKKFTDASLSFMTQIVMNDLKSYIQEDGKYLSPEARIDIDGWFEWAVEIEVTEKEKELILEEVHEGLQMIDIWSPFPEDQIVYFEKIIKYFTENYNKSQNAIAFSKIILDYYKKELIYI